MERPPGSADRSKGFTCLDRQQPGTKSIRVAKLMDAPDRQFERVWTRSSASDRSDVIARAAASNTGASRSKAAPREMASNGRAIAGSTSIAATPRSGGKVLDGPGALSLNPTGNRRTAMPITPYKRWSADNSGEPQSTGSHVGNLSNVTGVPSSDAVRPCRCQGAQPNPRETHDEDPGDWRQGDRQR